MPERGYLFVVGGAEDRLRDKHILARFVERTGADASRLVVVATASSVPDELLETYRAAFGDLGATDVTLCAHDQRADVDDTATLEALDRATGVFFTGGDQLKLASILGGTTFADRLMSRYQHGLHVGGTSAGASVLSAVMIARGRARRAPRISSLRLAPGLGLLPEAVVDQHFQERDRFGRLMSAVLENPGMLGFGIDEDTAFVVDPQGGIEVIGRGTLTVVDGSAIGASNISEVREHQPIAFSGLTVHVLSHGWGFDLPTRAVEPPNGHDQRNSDGIES